ncbi:MAG: hydrogenase iron-sulfur subunit [Coriobacteriales bacterium]|nr:hydrogenase iron-sulfur subunit [Coriobacteriales bacterium]
MPLGIFASRCAGRIDSAVDLDEALRGVSEQAAVVRVFEDLFAPGVAARIITDIENEGLDAVALVGPSADHWTRSVSAHHLRDTIEAAGVNHNRIATANLLEQVALVHPDDRQAATAKAASLINVAAIRATRAGTVEASGSTPLRTVLVLGVTSEALVASQRLLQLGFEVTLADRGDGSVTATNRRDLRATGAWVLDHPSATFIDRAEMLDGDGWLGDFRVKLATPDGVVEKHVGGILLARPDQTEWVSELRAHFRVDVDDDGRARSLDPVRHPAETIDPGIMVVPLRGQDAIERERVAAADAAAMAILLRLSSDEVTHSHDVSSIDETLCGGCASCVRTCAFGACYIDAETGLSHVEERRCRACGKCVVSCPVGARDLLSAPHDVMVASVHELAAAEVDGPKVIGFLCGGCGYPAADAAAEDIVERGSGYPASFLPLRIPCGGRLDAIYVLEAFRAGFDGVSVYRCREGHCHNLIGNLDMDRRINLLRTVLRARGIDDARLRIVDISSAEGDVFLKSLDEMFELVGGHVPSSATQGATVVPLTSPEPASSAAAAGGDAS